MKRVILSVLLATVALPAQAAWQPTKPIEFVRLLDKIEALLDARGAV